MATDLSKLSDEEILALYERSKGGQDDGPGYGSQVAEDINKSITPSAIRGGVMATTALPNIYDLSTQGIAKAPKGIGNAYQWLADKALPEEYAAATRGTGGWTDKVAGAYDWARNFVDKARKEGVSATDPMTGKKISAPPGRVGSHTYGNTMQQVEQNTGPLYEAQTFPGKLVQGGMEAAPSLVGGAPGSVIKGLGAVAGSETAGELAEGTAAEPWMKLLGGFAGSFVPSGRKAPNPIFPATPEHQKMVNLVQPYVKNLSAGQVTGSPFIQKMEGMGGLSTEPQIAQASAHALSRAGLNTPTSQKGIADIGEVRAAKSAAGQEKSDIFSQNQLKHDQQFEVDLMNAKKAAGKIPVVAPGNQPADIQKLRQELEDTHNRILYHPTVGTSTNTRHTSMLGPTAEELINNMRNLNKRAWKSDAERVAAGAHDTGTALRNAMDRSLVGTPSEGKLGPLREQYTAAKAIEGLTKKQGSGAPLEMKNVYASLLKTKNPKADQTPLGQFANAADKVGVGKPLPKFDTENASLAKVLGGMAIAGGGSYLHGLGAGGGVPAGGEFLSGYFGTPTVLNILGRLAGKTISRPGVQSHLPNAGTDKDMLARLLLTQGAPRMAAEMPE